MTEHLEIRLEEDCSFHYGYEQGLRAICEALQNELGAEYEKLSVELVEHSRP